MTISVKDRKTLWTRARNICSYPGCRQELTVDGVDAATGTITVAVVGEEAHIRSARPAGPRHDPAYPKDRLDAYENLILLCPTHHSIIDANGGAGFGAGALVRMRAAHERRFRRRWSLPMSAVLVLVLVLVVVGVGWWMVGTDREWPRPMRGDFNIAVVRSSPGDRLQDFANEVPGELRQRLRALHPDLRTEVIAVTLDRSLDTDGAMSEVAARLNAHILIWPVVRVDGDETIVSPRLFVTPAHVRDAPEVAGELELDDLRVLGRLPLDPLASAELRGELLAAAAAIAELVPGLAYYEHQNHERAREAFRRAADGKSAAVRIIAHLMLGNIQIRQDDLVGAERHYRQAFADRPEFVRAELGLAQLVYRRSFRECDGPDAAGLDESQRLYQKILSNGFATPMTRARADFGLGQIHVCRSQALLSDEWQQARTALTSVIQLYRMDGNLLMRELASEAYALLAFADSPAEGGGPQREKTRQAILQFDRAAQLALDSERRKLFLDFKANLQKRLGEAQCPSLSAPPLNATVRC
ncbi:hypothetical protein Ssi03_14480 [Sphaerisporangium siamense]|uniref:Tetratricopeptide (TPR) repeat protein n=1 Tax=Sphaerisporangium siamense TaxID=795645 RepID=A0A7W7G9G1_9ACTN|nr:hypothetical protein [Sphaerisporangium siamense]MBB4702788.1 tetratricopeptide (TPR) repeat protein [Sphaerisporangium siamense]GII83458.1 hypothetical protein Ssi03_14480 [Sphaerisporangium siamense]